MPRIEVRGANGMFCRSDEPDIARAGPWLVWALQMAEASNYMPAQVSVCPLFAQAPGGDGPQQPDWPQESFDRTFYRVTSVRSLIENLQEIEREAGGR
jgi:hypothetical protein